MAKSEMEKAIDKLVQKEPGWKEFLPKPASPQPATAGSAPNGTPGAGGGNAGDLTEYAYNMRTYYARRTIRSTDGMITWLFDPIKRVSMRDANGSAVNLTFADPVS